MVRVGERALDWAGLPESVTCTSMAAEFTAADGMPVIAPLAASARPAGSAPLASAQ
jgi:hypothetical protein